MDVSKTKGVGSSTTSGSIGARKAEAAGERASSVRAARAFVPAGLFTLAIAGLDIGTIDSTND